jgi:hypothetical protein
MNAERYRLKAIYPDVFMEVSGLLIESSKPDLKLNSS